MFELLPGDSSPSPASASTPLWYSARHSATWPSANWTPSHWAAMNALQAPAVMEQWKPPLTSTSHTCCRLLKHMQHKQHSRCTITLISRPQPKEPLNRVAMSQQTNREIPSAQHDLPCRRHCSSALYPPSGLMSLLVSSTAPGATCTI